MLTLAKYLFKVMIVLFPTILLAYVNVLGIIRLLEILRSGKIPPIPPKVTSGALDKGIQSWMNRELDRGWAWPYTKG